MLCLPGLTPVANDAHAVGDSGDCVVASGIMPPRSASRFMFGSLPSFIHLDVSAGSRPSNPRITIRCAWVPGRRRPLHAGACDSTAARATTRTTAKAAAGPVGFGIDAGIIATGVVYA